MKRIVFYLFALLYSYQLMAQSFTANNADGMPLNYQVTSTSPREVKLTGYGAIPSGYTLGTILNIPGTVTYGGDVYSVVELNSSCFMNKTEFTKVNLAEGIREIGSHCFMESSVKEFTFPHSLNKIGVWAFLLLSPFYSGAPLDLLDFSNTSVEEFSEGCLQFNTYANVFIYNNVAFPASTKKIHEYVMGGLGLTTQHPNIYLNTINPPTIVPRSWGTPQKNPFKNTKKIYVPIDATKRYADNVDWAKYAGRYYEQVKIGASGYATLYLSTENFKVPAGCDAFVIENITKATTPGGLDKANAKKFVAGDIIPAAQAVILRGTAGQTYEYQANVSGTPVTITDNMLVGTATDQTINAAGYDYYLFGNGALGQGFYRQTGHDKSSISLKAHKAGLRIPKGGGGSAKAFVIDFDAADTYVPTGIQSVKTPQPQTDVIYDLQGRRVTHPTRGIYIMNGKKMVFN